MGKESSKQDKKHKTLVNEVLFTNFQTIYPKGDADYWI